MTKCLGNGCNGKENCYRYTMKCSIPFQKFDDFSRITQTTPADCVFYVPYEPDAA